MKNYRELIESIETEKIFLYQLDKKTNLLNHDRVSWQQACQNYNSIKSKIDTLVQQAYRTKNYTDEKFKNNNLLEFIITYLEVDPWYPNSGYIKQYMLRKIKRMTFTPQQLIRLKIVLEDAVEQRPHMEFKSYCSLAHVIADQELIDHLNKILEQPASCKRNRAQLMLGYMPHSNHLG